MFENSINCVFFFVFFFTYLIQINESIVAKTTITMPMNGGAVETVSTIETVPYWTRSRKSGEIFVVFNHTTKLTRLFLDFFFFFFNWTLILSTVAPAWADTTTTDQSETVSEAPSITSDQVQPRTPRANRGGKKHNFIPKTVILQTYCWQSVAL